MMQIIKKNSGFIISGLIALTTLSPVIFILFSGFKAEPEIWIHLKQYVLPGLLKNTAILVVGVVSITALFGITLAWLTSFYDFFGRRLFERILLLPLAIPAYVMAFIYAGLLGFSGPVQTFIRANIPFFAPYFPEIRSAWGVIMVISLSIFPYVYLMASSGFRSTGRSMIEASQSLHAGRYFTLFRVIIPLARPWIFGGLVLVFMETLADFGAVSVFNYDTFTTGVYKAWYGFFSISAASQLASILVIIVLMIFFAESYFRRKQQYFTRGNPLPMEREALKGKNALLAFMVCSLIFSLSFVIPVGQLIFWTFKSFETEAGSHYFRLLTNTFALGIMGTVFTMGVAVILAYCVRTMKDSKTGFAAKLSLAGYALPGTVLAVGMMNVVARVDNLLINFLSDLGIQVSGMISGSLLLLPIGYMIRFLTAGFNPVASNMTRLTASMDEASRIMKVSGMKLLSKIHLPLIHRGIITGAIFVLVEIIKEMPITLMLRPFGWDTLAVKIFELTSEGEWERAALPAITLVIAGMVPIFMLTFIGRDKK